MNHAAPFVQGKRNLSHCTMRLKQEPRTKSPTHVKKWYLYFIHAGIIVLRATKAGSTGWCCWGVTASFCENFRTCQSFSTWNRQGKQIQPNLQRPITPPWLLSDKFPLLFQPAVLMCQTFNSPLAMAILSTT